MAKISSLFGLSGTIGNMTFVDSRAYKKHVRKKKGSHAINDALRKSCAELSAATPFAKRIKDSVNPYLTDFKDGELWTRLRSFVRTQLRAAGQVDYKQLEDMQFHKEHSLHSLLRGKIELSASSTEEELSVSLPLRSHPYFPVHYINAYRFTVVVVAISADGTSTQTWDHVFPVTMLKGKAMGEQTLHFPVGKEMKSFIICLKCDGYQDAVIMNNLRTKGMAVLKVVERQLNSEFRVSNSGLEIPNSEFRVLSSGALNSGVKFCSGSAFHFMDRSFVSLPAVGGSG
jgi:hypothetical protein